VNRAGLVSSFDRDVLTYAGAKGPGTIDVFVAIAGGVRFIGWNKPVAGAIASDGRRLLRNWIAEMLQERMNEGVPSGEGSMPDNHIGGSAKPELVDGFVPPDTIVDGPSELHQMLTYWIRSSTASTVGDVGAFGGSPVIVVRMARDEFVLNRDTKRAAVETFLSAAARADGAANLRWHVTTNAKGRLNRVSYRDDDGPTPGWFAYLRRPSAEGPRDLR
jgi:hypothetical protein